LGSRARVPAPRQPNPGAQRLRGRAALAALPHRRRPAREDSGRSGSEALPARGRPRGRPRAARPAQGGAAPPHRAQPRATHGTRHVAACHAARGVAPGGCPAPHRRRGVVARLRDAARAYAERHYGWERAIASLESELVRLVDGAATPLPAAACEACGEPLGPARLAYRGLLYRRCAACGARALATIPT